MNKTGSLIIETFESRVLKNNPLKDPYIRDFPVYLPPSYFSSPKKRYPVAFLISGFTGKGIMYLNVSFLSENIQQRLDRLISAGKMKEMIVVLPDCITKYGGSQFINSTATGKYEDYVIKELVPYIDSKFRTIPESRSRAVCGKSSGGYGSVILAMKNPSVFGLMCSTAGDMAFEYCYLPGFPNALNGFEQFGKGHKGVENFIKKKLNYDLPKPGYYHDMLNAVGMASCYSPNPSGFRSKGYNFDLPFDVHTCEIDDKIFRKWQNNDPVRLVGKYSGNLKKLKLIYLDAGIRDEYYLHAGARIFCDKLKKKKIKFIHEEFDGGHMNIPYRFDRTFEIMSQFIKN